MASSGDVVESPNYPHKYQPLADCKWTLEGPQGHNILLQVFYVACIEAQLVGRHIYPQISYCCCCCCCCCVKEVHYLKLKRKSWKLCRIIYVICILWAKNWSGHNYCVFLQMCVLSNHKFKYEKLLLYCKFSYEFWFSHEVLYLPLFLTYMCLFFYSFKNSKQRSHLTQFRFWWVGVLKTSPLTWQRCQANKISVTSCLFQPQTSWSSNSALMHLWKEKGSGSYSISIYAYLEMNYVVSWTTGT